MDLYFVESLSLQNHLSAPWPEMSKGILLCGHAICAIDPCCRAQGRPNWVKTIRILCKASTTWHFSSKPRGAWWRPSLFTARLSRRAGEPSFKDFHGTLGSGSGVAPYWTFVNEVPNDRSWRSNTLGYSWDVFGIVWPKKVPKTAFLPKQNT